MRRLLPLSLLLLACSFAPAHADQVEDSTWVPKVAKPTFTGRHVVVMIDQKHNNYFSRSTHYRAFAALLAKDGMIVAPGVQRFGPSLLKNCQVLVVADAAGAPQWSAPKASAPAFYAGESDVVGKWVEEGGSLLLVVDNDPFASAMKELVGRFGVDMSYGPTVDPEHQDPETRNPGCLLFRRDQGLIADHPIMRGRDAGERIDQVATFTGQSLTGPRGSTGLLILGPAAADLPGSTGVTRTVDPEAERLTKMDPELKSRGALPAVGRFQALAFEYGKGRVVVLGDGAMFSTQKVVGDEARARGKDALRIGLNRPDLDNQQFALNILHWLTRELN